MPLHWSLSMFGVISQLPSISNKPHLCFRYNMGDKNENNIICQLHSIDDPSKTAVKCVGWIIQRFSPGILLLCLYLSYAVYGIIKSYYVCWLVSCCVTEHFAISLSVFLLIFSSHYEDTVFVITAIIR